MFNRVMSLFFVGDQAESRDSDVNMVSKRAVDTYKVMFRGEFGANLALGYY